MVERFSTKRDTCGDSFSYVGLTVQRDRNAPHIYVSQARYLRRVLGTFGMLSCRGRATPMGASVKRRARTEGKEEAADKNQYRHVIGCLLYAALSSRPDIVYAVNVFGRFASDPSVEHWRAIRPVLRYVKSKLDLTLPIINPSLCGCR